MGEEIKDVTEYTFYDENGDAHITIYHLFSGVEVAYICAHMGEFDFALIEQKYEEKYVGIHFCKEKNIPSRILESSNRNWLKSETDKILNEYLLTSLK